MLAKMQSSKNRVQTLQENDRDDPHEKVRNLQTKLDDAVSKISELTSVLDHLNKDYNTERYYEESAKVIADADAKGRSIGGPVVGGGQSYGGGASQVGGRDRTGMLSNSQVTGSMRTTKKRI